MSRHKVGTSKQVANETDHDPMDTGEARYAGHAVYE